MDLHLERCTNCGNEWAPKEYPSSGDTLDAQASICPVCHFHLMPDRSPLEEPLSLSVDDLQASMIALMTHARASGLLLEEILGVLSDELAFAAELTAPGHRMLVQIMDLGQFEPALRPRHTARAPELLHSRALGQ